jgi:hypothetical protein
MLNHPSAVTNANIQAAPVNSLPGLPKRWTVVRFLTTGGCVLVTLGLTGVLGLLGALSSAPFFHPPNWINWLHLSFGTFVLAVAFKGHRKLQLGLATLGAVAGPLIGFAGLGVALGAAVRFGTSPWADVPDALSHLAVGSLAILALRNARRERLAAA